MGTFGFDTDPSLYARMKVVGVGGAGGNAVNHMIAEGVPGVEFIVANTDAQDLAESNARYKIQLGREITRGLGAGADPDTGRLAAEESRAEIEEHLADLDMVFITAGMGGGTGTGAAPVVAQIARELGILTIGVVTRPFQFEGPKRSKNADSGLSQLRESVDTVVVIPNQKLKEAVSKNTTFKDALKYADDVLLQATRGVSDLITLPGLINVDFADVKTTMFGKGDALMGNGSASGENRAREAAQRAMTHPLLEELEIDGAEDILVNLTGGHDLTLFDVDEAMTTVQESASNPNVILGTALDESLEGSVRITLIATGLNGANVAKNDDTQNLVKFRPERPTDLDQPTYQRNQQTAEPEEVEAQPQETVELSAKDDEPEDLEVPTYMRRRRLFGT
jgi:cell division protein FtsZ